MPQHGGNKKVLNREGATTVFTRDNEIFVDVAGTRVGNDEPGGNGLKCAVNVVRRKVEANDVREEGGQKNVESGNTSTRVHFGESSFEEIGTVTEFV